MSQMPLSKLYQQWQPWLSWFDVKLQPILADLLSQLDLLLGPIKEEQVLNQNGETGLGTISQRGVYEHLLLSEWLLSEEEPDEFIRRAAVNEHLFLAPIPEQSKSNNMIIALFDSGILQLGRARLVHLVMMLLLDRRTQKNHSQFYWGIIQQSAQLNEFLGIDSLLTLLSERSLCSVSHKNIDDWSAYLQENVSFDECWFIGASITKANMNEKNMFSHYVNVDPVIIENDQLKVTITNNYKQRACHLVLPNEVICMKMLTGQLTHYSYQTDIIKKSVVTIDANFCPIISATGNHLVTLNKERTNTLFCSLSDILSVKQKCSINFHHISDELLALDFQGKKLSGIVKNKDEVYFWQPNKSRVKLSFHSRNWLCDKQHYQIFMWLYSNHATHVYLVNKDKELFCYNIDNFSQNETCIGIRVDTQVLGLVKLDNKNSLYIKLEEDGCLWLRSPQLPILRHNLGQMDNIESQKIYITNESRWLTGSGIHAIGIKQNWTLFKPYSLMPSETLYHELPITIPVDWQVFGLYHQNNEEKTVFLLINQDGKRIALFNIENRELEEIYYSSSNIIQYTFSSLAKSFALTTESGHLILYSLLSNSVRVNIIKG